MHPDISFVDPEQQGAFAALYTHVFGSPENVPLLASAGCFTLGLHAGKQMVGFFTGRILGHEGEIISIGVLPDMRRAGLGGQLMEAGLAEFKHTGVERLFLEVAADNAAAKKLYEAHGFMRSGERKGYYTAGRAQGQDAELWQLSFNS